MNTLVNTINDFNYNETLIIEQYHPIASKISIIYHQNYYYIFYYDKHVKIYYDEILNETILKNTIKHFLFS